MRDDENIAAGKKYIPAQIKTDGTFVSGHFEDENGNQEIITLKGKTYQGHSSESYEKLFEEVFKGNEDMFVSEEEVESSWVIVDQIREAWVKLPLIKYEKGKEPLTNGAYE